MYSFQMPNPSSPLRPPPSAEEVLAELETKLVNGEWEVGGRLPSERILAEQFGISRPGIREVLGRLEERGLIDVRAGLGSFVCEIRPTRGSASLDHLVRRGDVTIHDVVVARAMLESEAAALAAKGRTEADVEQMRRLLGALDASTDLRTAADLDVAFHEAVAIASKNQVLQIMFGSIRDLARGMIVRSLDDRNARLAGTPIHREILEHIENQDADKAREAMARHLSLAVDFYGVDLDMPLARVLEHRALKHPEVADLLNPVHGLR